MTSLRSFPVLGLCVLAAAFVSSSARAASNYVAEVTQPFLSIARDEHASGASAGAVSPIGAWSAQAEIDSDLGSARATTVACEIAAGFQQVCNTIAARGDGSDYIRLLPTETFPAGTPVEIVFYWFLDGSVDGIGAWSAGGSLTLIGNSPFFPLVSIGHSYSTGGVPVDVDQVPLSAARTATATLFVGQTYWMTTVVHASSVVLTCPFGSSSCDIPLGIDVDFANGAFVGARPRGGGYAGLQLVGDSGRDYLVPLPEPSSGIATWLGLIGGARVAVSARRWSRRRADQ